jgi:hypothetical protein
MSAGLTSTASSSPSPAPTKRAGRKQPGRPAVAPPDEAVPQRGKPLQVEGLDPHAPDGGELPDPFHQGGDAAISPICDLGCRTAARRTRWAWRRLSRSCLATRAPLVSRNHFGRPQPEAVRPTRSTMAAPACRGTPNGREGTQRRCDEASHRGPRVDGIGAREPDRRPPPPLERTGRSPVAGRRARPATAPAGTG